MIPTAGLYCFEGVLDGLLHCRLSRTLSGQGGPESRQCDMSLNTIRLQLLADTHLGFDTPRRPRIERRRRGTEFFDNYLLAIQAARDEKVDLVVHGGDLFYRSRIPDSLVSRVFAPLIELADQGIPVFIVPGNHERSHIRQGLFDLHPDIHVFSQPSTFPVKIRGMRLGLSGFQFVRSGVRSQFRRLTEATAWRRQPADARLLCLHQALDGAQVGVRNYTFCNTPDVVKRSDVPQAFQAVLAGHIHRHQVLDKGVPVYYPGATCRTSFAERLEPKGYIVLTMVSCRGCFDLRHMFVPLPARPMVELSISSQANRTGLAKRLARLDPHSIVRIRADRPIEWLRAETLRRLAPATMNIEIRPQPQRRQA